MSKNNSIPRRKTMPALKAALIFGGMCALWPAAFADDLSAVDSDFFAKAADAGATEISASKAADKRSSSAAVKSFAASMIADHTKVASKLKQLAHKKNVQLSEQPSRPHQAEIDKLNTLKGKEFDSEYVNQIGVSAHQEAVALFRGIADNAKDADVRAFAAHTLPSLEHHLKMAEALKTSLDKAPQ